MTISDPDREKNAASVLFSGIFLYFVRFASVLAQAASLLYASRIVSLQEYGGFAFGFGVATIFSTIIMAGGNQVLLRSLPGFDIECNASDIRRILVTVTIRLCLVSCIVFLAAITICTAINNIFGAELENINALLALSFTIAFTTLLSSVLRQTTGAGGLVLIKDFLPFTSFLFVIAIFSQLSWSASELVTTLLFSYVFSGLIGLFIARKYLAATLVANDFSPKNTQSDYGYKDFWVSSLIATVLANIDIIIGRLILGELGIAIYSILKRASSLLGICQNIANLAISREIVENLGVGNRARLQNVVSYAFYLAFPVALLFGITLILGSSSLFSYFDIPENLTNDIALLIVTIAALFNVFCGANILLAAQSGNEKVVLKTRAAILLLSVVFTPLLCHYYGVIGLAISFLLQAMILNMITTKYLWKALGIWTSIPVGSFLKK